MTAREGDFGRAGNETTSPSLELPALHSVRDAGVGLTDSVATWKRELKLPWREAGPPNHLDEGVDSDQ